MCSILRVALAGLFCAHLCPRDFTVALVSVCVSVLRRLNELERVKLKRTKMLIKRSEERACWVTLVPLNVVANRHIETRCNNTWWKHYYAREVEFITWHRSWSGSKSHCVWCELKSSNIGVLCPFCHFVCTQGAEPETSDYSHVKWYSISSPCVACRVVSYISYTKCVYT